MKHIFFTLLFCCCANVILAQQKGALLPKSIYTLSANYQFSTTAINQKLNLKSSYGYPANYIDNNLNSNYLINTEVRDPNTNAVSNTNYTGLYNENLLKGFLDKHDPTRWQPCQFLVPAAE